MAKYAISKKGVYSLKKLSYDLRLSVKNIDENNQKLEMLISGNVENLGIYGEGILDVIQQNEKTLNTNLEDIINLAKKINKQADDIQNLVSLGLGEFEAASYNSQDNTEFSSDTTAQRDYLVSNDFVMEADFGRLDIRTANDMCIAIQETMEMFPELDLRFVGSMQARNERLRMQLIDLYMPAYRKCNPKVPDAQLLAAVQQRIDWELRDFVPKSETIAQSYSFGHSQNPFDNVFAAMSGITINEAYGSDYDYFIGVHKSDVNKGWHPQNCYSPKATVDHELGHQIAGLVNAHEDSEIQNYYNDFMLLDYNGKTRALSGYAGKDIHEFIAESWSEYRNNPQCRDGAKCVAERIIELYEQKRKTKILKRR